MKRISSYAVVVGVIAGLGALILAPRQCRAHKIMMYASAEGKTITGSVYFSGGGRVKNATIRVEDGTGKKLGEMKTDGQGEFSYEADARCDHVFVARTPDGHRATYTVQASELPSSLPTREGSRKPPEQTAGPAPADDEAGEQSPEKNSKPAVSREHIRHIVEKAVARQVRPLRRELQKYRAHARMTDILGGIGYIFGVMGVILYLKKKWRDRRD